MTLGETAAKLSPQDYERNFAEISPLLDPRQAAVESARCLYCFDAPCTAACPTRIDVPAFIRKISSGNLRGSARVILESNILGESCGRVCPTEALCEGACVMHEKAERPIAIGRLQRYAVAHVLDHHLELFRAAQPNGMRIACLGAGPASLGCAAELAKRGYAVTVFDRRELSGGLNTYGIAAYKSRARDSLREVELVRQLGVQFRQNTEIGRDVSFADLEKQFNAIFIGMGLGDTESLALPGENLHGVLGALEFLEQTKLRPFAEIEMGRRVACIGAGNTAIDVVTAARRLGADEVHMIYRRGEEDASAFDYEFELAQRDNVIFHWHTQPIRVVGANGFVTGLECVRTEATNSDGARRPAPEPIPGTNFILPVDMVVRAIGQKPVTEILRAVRGIALRPDGTVAVSERHRTGNPKYFAGGDCVNGGREVVDAVAEGMSAARSIHASLGPSAAAGPPRAAR